MALSLNTVWEVRTVGSNTNGGGFVTGAAGTDYSQQNASQYALTNGVTNGTTTIATVSASADMVGNIVYVAGGTGAITGSWYQITAQSLGVSVTVDRSTGLTAGTGVTLNIGGALQTLAQMLTNFSVAGMTAYVKATATYSISTGLTASLSGIPTVNRVIGYTSVRTDLGMVTVQASAGITMLSQSGNAWSFENFIFDGNGTGTNGINSTGLLRLCSVVVKNLTGYGITKNSSSGTSTFDRVEISGCGTTAGLRVFSGITTLNESYIHDNTVPGVVCDADEFSLIDSVIESNSGASSDGLNLGGNFTIIKGNVFYNNGRDGLRLTSLGAPYEMPILVNNIFDSNAGWGVNDNSDGSGTTKQIAVVRNNAFRGNGSGQATAFSMLSAVTLSADPFTNSAAGDFTLNNVSGGGAACRAAGSPGSFIGLSVLGYRDVGALQHQDSPSIISVSSITPVIVNRFGVAGY